MLGGQSSARFSRAGRAGCQSFSVRDRAPLPYPTTHPPRGLAGRRTTFEPSGLPGCTAGGFSLTHSATPAITLLRRCLEWWAVVDGKLCPACGTVGWPVLSRPAPGWQDREGFAGPVEQGKGWVGRWFCVGFGKELPGGSGRFERAGCRPCRGFRAKRWPAREGRKCGTDIKAPQHCRGVRANGPAQGGPERRQMHHNALSIPNCSGMSPIHEKPMRRC